jgi:hypothetical protein
MGYDRFIEEQLPPDVWKYLPHTFATVMSGGLWVPFKHLILLSHIITAAIARGNGRIIISLPPRHGKSWFLSQWLPAWFLSMWPDKKVILSTYEANFAATWGRRVRNIIKQDGHRVGVSLAEDATASNNWETSMGGGMMTAGIGGPITGKGLSSWPHRRRAQELAGGTVLHHTQYHQRLVRLDVLHARRAGCDDRSPYDPLARR